MPREMNETNEEIRKWVYEFYEKNRFHHNNDTVDWHAAERQMGKRPRSYRGKKIQNTLFAIWGMVCVTAAVFLIMSLGKNPDRAL